MDEKSQSSKMDEKNKITWGWMRQCLKKSQSSKMDEKKKRIWKSMRNSVLDG
jgi:hypothetical protein